MIERRLIHLDGIVDLADGDEAVAQSPGHALVELDYDHLGTPDRGQHRVDRGAERAEAVLVGRGHVEEYRVQGQEPALDQARNV